MSRFHAEVLCRGSKLYIRDLGSSNGTLVNGVTLTSEHKLCSDDKIQLGDTTLQILLDEQSKNHNDTNVVLHESQWGETRASIARANSDQTTKMIAIQAGQAVADSGDYQLASLAKVAEEIRSVLELNDLLDIVMDHIFEIFQPDRGVVLLREDDNAPLKPRIIRQGDKRTKEIAVSCTITDQAIHERVSVLVHDTGTDARFKSSESVVYNKIRAAICAPLIFRNRVMGVLYIDTQSRLLSYNKGDLELFSSLASLVAVSIAEAQLHAQLIDQARLKRDLEIAHDIQMRLICHDIPQPTGFEIAAMTIPARAVGGDFYDFIEIEDDRLGVAVSDVSGKGIPAAILASSIRSALRVKVQNCNQPLPEMIADLNKMTFQDSTDVMFATLLFGYLEIEKRNFKYTNAGHSLPILFKPDGEIFIPKPSGCVIGIYEQLEWQEENFELPPGSTPS